MGIATKTGDRGRTSLFSGERVSKSDERVAAYGDVDELSSVLGALAASLEGDPDLRREVEQIQGDLFCVGGWLATTPESQAYDELPELDPSAVGRLEDRIDEMEGTMPPIRGFILPGGRPTAAWAHLARTVCRRVERHVVGLMVEGHGEAEKERLTRIAVYLNRLSDYLFDLARTLNHRHGIPDIAWEPEKGA